ncbi:MAG: hypothetical protein ACR2QW_08045 [bacterium]
MFSVVKSSLPDDAFLARYAEGKSHTDCYFTEIEGAFSLPDYIFAFYTTRIFKLERVILKIAASKPSDDGQARGLADGDSETFAAWSVEQRDHNQILLGDYLGKTKSWLMVSPVLTAPAPRTTLFFGSAVVATKNPKSGESELGSIYQALLGFHKFYSQLLLSAARSRLKSL